MWMSHCKMFWNIVKNPSLKETFNSIPALHRHNGVAVCLAHLLFLLAMKGRWSAANVPQLWTTIHFSPLNLYTVIKRNLAAKYTSSYICMEWLNSLRWHPLVVQSHWGGQFGKFACVHKQINHEWQWREGCGQKNHMGAKMVCDLYVPGRLLAWLHYEIQMIKMTQFPPGCVPWTKKSLFSEKENWHFRLQSVKKLRKVPLCVRHEYFTSCRKDFCAISENKTINNKHFQKSLWLIVYFIAET